jgi:homoserine kinase
MSLHARPDSARVRVCASTSNLGPGFDVVGMALDLDLEVRAHRRGDAVRLVGREGEALSWPGDDTDLLVRAARRAFTALGGEGGIELEARSEIPVGRGLGSSAAAVVAGLLLGAHFAPRRVERDTLLAWAIELEGHPDNVTPALYGGCRMTCPRADGAPRPVALELHPELGFALAWPDAPLPTAFARSLLPRQVPLELAVDTARRLALVLEGLRRGDPELLAAGQTEHLHVPHRLPHIQGGERALAAARAAGTHLATISGAGSALFAVTRRDEAERVARAMGEAFRTAGAGGSHRAARVVDTPPAVETFDAS